MSMLCYICGKKAEIIDSRFVKAGGYTRRRYRCIKNHRFTTVEEPVKDGVLTSRGGISELVHKNKPSQLAKTSIMAKLKRILDSEDL